MVNNELKHCSYRGRLREQIREIAITLLVSVVFVLLPEATADGQGVAQSAKSKDWAGFLGPNRDSKSVETGILKDWSSGKLEVRWTADVGTGYVLGSVADGKFYQFEAVDSTARLVCRDAGTGEKNWDAGYEFEYKDMYGFDNGPRATPQVDGDRVYTLGVEGMLHCFDTKDGSVIWKLDTNKKFGVVQNFFGVGSSPLIVGDDLIVMVGGSPESDQANNGKRIDGVKSNGSAIAVLDKLTGKVKHSFGKQLASYSSVQTYRDGSDTLGVAWLRGGLMGFDFKAGKVLWEFPYRARRYESVNASTPVVDGTRIFVSESYGLGSIVLDVKSKSEPAVIWRDTNPREQSLALHWATPVLHEGYLYASHGSGKANAELRCVEFATGEVKWKQKGYGRASVTYVDGHLIVLDENGKLSLLKANHDKFELVSEYSDADGNKLSIEYPCWAAPVVAGGRLYVRGKDKIVCLQLIPE